MNVIFSSSNEYAPYLGVALNSFLKHNFLEFDEINVYIMDGGINKINKNKLKTIGEQYNQSLNFIQFDNIEEKKGIKIDSEHLGIFTYFRLFLPSLLPNLDKILCLDSDSITVGSFKELYETDIQDYCCAGVLDTISPYAKRLTQIPKQQNYINAGVLLLNLKKWRENNLEEKFINYLIKNEGKIKFPFDEQGIINHFLDKNNILIIDPSYNLMHSFYLFNHESLLSWFGMKEYYNEEIIENAKKNPVFIHFADICRQKPWLETRIKHKNHDLYKKYVDLTPFKDEIYIKDNRPIKLKIISLGIKILPNRISSLFWRKYMEIFREK